jgi:glycosyltransferase involved in cell wall biosynthesis
VSTSNAAICVSEEFPRELPRSGNIRVLTITPFYPSDADSSQGRFISGPLDRIAEFGVANLTVAVQPFYRDGHNSRAGSEWASYFSVPGNLGLASAGKFVAASVLRKLTKHGSGAFDVIHAHAALPCGHAAAILSQRLGIPFVVTVHGLDAFFVHQGGLLAGEWCKRVATKVYGDARRVICISEKVRQQVSGGTQANTRVVYNGVDPQFFSPPGDEPALTVLSVGNLIPSKGHAQLLRAFAAATAAMPDCKLQIVGDGPERARLNKLASALGMSDKVIFCGRRTQEYVADAMRRCSVFALPSSYEGLGCVYLEAMACSKPVIGCRGQGIEEIIENGRNGILVAPGDHLQVADSLQGLLRNRELRRHIGAAARSTILQRFTLNQQARQLADIYRECAA